MDVGRMAVIADPQGAFFMVWEPKSTIGAELVNVPGAFCWNELYTSDLDGAQGFYAGLFGWEWTAFEQSPDPYFVVMNQGRGNGGVRGLAEPGMPPELARLLRRRGHRRGRGQGRRAGRRHDDGGRWTSASRRSRSCRIRRVRRLRCMRVSRENFVWHLSF